MQRVQSDIATWAISVSSSVKITDENAKTRGNALSNVSADAKKVVEFLRKSGFDASEIKTSNVSVYNMYTKNKNGYDTTEVCGKTAECTVSVQTRKFDLLFIFEGAVLAGRPWKGRLRRGKRLHAQLVGV